MEVTYDESFVELMKAFEGFDALVDKGIIDPDSEDFYDSIASFFFTAGIQFVADKYGIKTPATGKPAVLN